MDDSTSQKVMYGNGMFNVYKTKKDKTASYIYCVDPHSGTYYFAICRKIPLGFRKRIKPHSNTGAAGTKEKYMGKWGSFGGGSDKRAKNTLEAAICEINDEAGIKHIYGKKFTIDDVSINSKKKKLNLVFTDDMNLKDIGLFIFEMTDSKLFFKLFPKIKTNPRSGAYIVESSHGEIDSVGSYTMNEIITKQIDSNKHGNNFFLSYFCSTFNRYIKPYFENISKSFAQKWAKTSLSYITDIKDRKTSQKKTYIEYAPGKYK